MTNAYTTTGATIGPALDLTLDPFELSAGAVDRLLADVMRPTLLVKLRDALATTSGPHEAAETAQRVAREHYRQYVVVDVNLSEEQLDIVVRPAGGGEPMETLRDELAHAMRAAAYEVVAKRAALLS